MDVIQQLIPANLTNVLSAQSIMKATTTVLPLLAGLSAAGHLKACPRDEPLSCHNTTAVANTCCFNAPGGLLLQTQFWDAQPSFGPVDSWTIHGLWPDNCDGTYGQYCDENRQYTNITQILQSFHRDRLLKYMNKYWVSNTGDDESFWEHEFGKHGTCISTLDPDCYQNYKPTQEVPQYFAKAVHLFQTLPTYEWLSQAGITPSNTTSYTNDAIQAALAQNHGYKATINCVNGSLSEAWYYFNVQGTAQHGDYVPAAPTYLGNCPDSIMYLPKD